MKRNTNWCVRSRLAYVHRFSNFADDRFQHTLTHARAHPLPIYVSVIQSSNYNRDSRTAQVPPGNPAPALSHGRCVGDGTGLTHITYTHGTTVRLS